MSARTAVAIALAVVSTTLTNLAYLREHDAAASLPCLSMRRPVQSLRLLLGDRTWLTGFLMEGGGFAAFAGAVSLASLAVVQSVGAGGIGVLAFISSRVSGRRLGRRRLLGVALSMLGLFALGVSLARGSGEGGRGEVVPIIAWMLCTGALAAVVLAVGRGRRGLAAAEGLAGGLLFSIGDLSTKVATEGGTRFLFVITLVIGYVLGSSLLQLGYQRGGTLTVAGLATLCTNALPIIAGTVLLAEPVPAGVFGALRVLAFCAVVAGAILLATPDPGAARDANICSDDKRGKSVRAVSPGT
jgi:hypothetical protein